MSASSSGAGSAHLHTRITSVSYRTPPECAPHVPQTHDTVVGDERNARMLRVRHELEELL